jgi:hypothetical protein
MKLRAILLLSGASLLLAVSIPSGLASAADEKGKMQAAPQAEAMQGKIAAQRGKSELVELPMAPAEERMMTQGVLPEGASRPTQPVPCPNPFSVTLPGSPGGVVHSNTGDFTNVHPYAWASGFGDANANKYFAYTFNLSRYVSNPKICCALTSATLTLNLKCINDIPENDTWGIVRNSASVPGSGGTIGWPSGCNGQTKTVTWTATAADVAHMNSDARLSFAIQDDTTVLSATLNVSGCCCGTCHRDRMPAE